MYVCLAVLGDISQIPTKLPTLAAHMSSSTGCTDAKYALHIFAQVLSPVSQCYAYERRSESLQL